MLQFTNPEKLNNKEGPEEGEDMKFIVKRFNRYFLFMWGRNLEEVMGTEHEGSAGEMKEGVINGRENWNQGKGASLGETQNIVKCKHIGIHEGNPSMSLTDKRTKQEKKIKAQLN